MSTIEVNRTRNFNMAVPVGTVSGSPVRLGWITGTALNDRDAVLGTADVAFAHDVDIVSIPVTALAAPPAGILIGDELYADAAAPTVVSNDPAQVHFGYALTAVPATTTVTINVIKGWL